MKASGMTFFLTCTHTHITFRNPLHVHIVRCVHTHTHLSFCNPLQVHIVRCTHTHTHIYAVSLNAYMHLITFHCLPRSDLRVCSNHCIYAFVKLAAVRRFGLNRRAGRGGDRLLDGRSRWRMGRTGDAGDRLLDGDAGDRLLDGR